MLILIILMFFPSIFILNYLVITKLTTNKLIIENRLQQLSKLQELSENAILNESFFERTINPIYKAINKLLLKAIPSNKMKLLNIKLERAGILKNTTTESWLYSKYMMILIFSISIAILVYMVDSNIFKVLIIMLFTSLFINTLYNFNIAAKIDKRKMKILKDLPYTLDLITVSVEAGLSFDGAMARVVSNINGELCDEFAKSLKEIKMGIQRKVALKSMGERCAVKELSMLITSIIQADDLGVSLGKVLRIEAANLREHRKQEAREKAMKAPIKMLFPLIFFIFPSIFIIILGPAVIKIMSIFKG